MALQFDIEPVGESRGHPVQQGGSRFLLAVQQQLVDRPARPAGQRDQPLAEWAKSFSAFTCAQSPGSTSR